MGRYFSPSWVLLGLTSSLWRAGPLMTLTFLFSDVAGNTLFLSPLLPVVTCICCCSVAKSCPILATSWTAAHQVPLSLTISWSSPQVHVHWAGSCPLVSRKPVSSQLPAAGVLAPLCVPCQAGLMLTLPHSQVRLFLMRRHTYTFLASPQPRNEVECTAVATLRAERQSVSYHAVHSPMGLPAAVVS